MHKTRDYVIISNNDNAFDFNNKKRLIFKKDVELAFYLIDTSTYLHPIISKLQCTTEVDVD